MHGCKESVILNKWMMGFPRSTILLHYSQKLESPMFFLQSLPGFVPARWCFSNSSLTMNCLRALELFLMDSIIKKLYPNTSEDLCATSSWTQPTRKCACKWRTQYGCPSLWFLPPTLCTLGLRVDYLNNEPCTLRTWYVDSAPPTTYQLPCLLAP